MDVIVNVALRAVVLLIGVGAGVWLVRWIADTRSHARERWPMRLAIGMLVLAGAYAAGHIRLLAQRESIEAGRIAYVRYGDPRRAELRRGEVRGWIMDCTGATENAFALYRSRGGRVDRVHPVGSAGENFVGGGEDADLRDYTVERLFSDHLRSPRGLGELGELHPAGTDLDLTLCSGLTARAWEFLQATDRPGAVLVQDVATGAVRAYAATGGPDQPPLGVREYAPPGSVFKLALAALWWDSGMEETTLPCPSSVRVTPRAEIHNSGDFSIASVTVPEEMLVFSCNTTAVRMAEIARERLGETAFARAYRAFGFEPYANDAPAEPDGDFWLTGSDQWASRMSPPPARVRLSDRTGAAEWAQIAIGQGPVDATVIHVSRFLQAIGNGGVMLPPTIEADALAGVVDEEERGVRVMSAGTAERLQRAMRGVVDRGTARRAAPIVDPTGWDLGGKTGTAQVRGRSDDGWFAGLVYGPSGEPRYSVVVYLRGGGPGGVAPTLVAARVAAAIAREEG